MRLLVLAPMLCTAGMVEIGRARADADLDVVAAWRGAHPGRAWVADTTLDLFLQSRSRPALRYNLASEKGRANADCAPALVRITANEVAIHCTPEKGNLRWIHKFVFDPRAKALVASFEYDVVTFDRVIRTATGALFKGKEPLALAYDGNSFRVLRAEPVTSDRRWPKLPPKPLPQSTWDQFASARPQRVRDGYSREATNIEELIGPRQVHNGVLWFGKSFYDGEGTSGVGGFGYYDDGYHVYSPPEIANWSVTAILVEKDAVWLGLASCGEWATTAGGLLRFDRATQAVERIELPDVIGDIVRVDDRLLLATDFGVAVVENGRSRRFFVDRLSDGRLRVAEANAPE